MSLTQTKTETEAPSIVGKSIIPENIEGISSASSETVGATGPVSDKHEAGGTSSAQAIEAARTVQPTDQTISNESIKSELAYIASLQQGKLGEQEPSAGFGSQNLPFAG